MTERRRWETVKTAASRIGTAVVVAAIFIGLYRGLMIDVEHKVRNIRQFIEKGQRVKVSVFFRGREITHPELGRQMLKGVVTRLQDIAKVDIEPRLEGRNMAMLLTPKG